ncbi:hypothetical protein LZP73_07330 [Shewanella sp. AS16]|uniref:hypothetical protein n=1 Tax=Shewanella sp. AS16 TaxID=2907625 RepID=UPI001F42C1F7|nr:hypothetical protein [Shewanella sp. AS16]MCE9686028.1 hypothetical protein [Shewanella sp. AS16]
MAWKHSGKTTAFDYTGLDAETAQAYGIACDPISLKSARIFITQQALAMLANLNHFDQRKVVKEIAHVCNNPGSCSSIKHSKLPFKRLWRSKEQFQSYHYLIDYKIGANGQVIIHDIYFDRSVTGAKTRHSLERNMLYKINRIPGAINFNGAWDSDDLDKVKDTWGLPEPTSAVSTQHAAVNGMQNELDKARWLMGTHLDVAYPEDDFKTYTLFHNPTDRMFYDVVECVFDKRQGTKSQNAQHLAAILQQTQQKGQKTKWVVHSQGAIIFSAALEEYRKSYTSALTCHRVVVHSPGAWLPRLKQAATAIGMTVVNERSNPFDIVPNLAGTNDLSPSSLARSLKFMGLTFLGTETTSPHTLPFLGLESYHAQLRFAGNHRRANDVLKYMEKHT